MVLHHFFRALRFPPAGGHYGHHNRDKYHVESEYEYEDDHVQRNKDKYDGNKEKYQDDYGDHNNRNKDKYYENKKLYGGFNVKEKYEDDFSHYENRNEDTHEKLGLKVKPKWRKAFQYFDGVGHSSNIHYSDDYDEVQSNKSTWSVVANKEK